MASIINASEFEEKVLKSTLPVLVDFYADWCGPCRMVSPIVDKLNEASEGAYKVYKVNIDKDGPLAAKYRVMTIPTLIIFKDGQEANRTVGAATFEALAQKLKSI